MICAIDCETTGLVPYYHEAVDICIMPLTDEFDPRNGVEPFIVQIKPEFPDRAEKQALQVNGHTLEELMERQITREIAINMFTEWFVKTIPAHQKIEPLAQNWSFDKAFLTATFQGLNLNKYLFYRARDTQRVVEYLNDRNRLHGLSLLFKSSALTRIAEGLNIEYNNPHKAENDCLVCAAVYKALCVK